MCKDLISVLSSILLGALLFTAGPTFAADYPLFTDNKMSPRYDRIVEKLQPGDRVIFSDHKIFTIDKILGLGSNTLILAPREYPKQALRISLAEDYSVFMDWFLNGYQILSQGRIPHLEITASYRNEYILIERLFDFVTFSEFVKAGSSSQTARAETQSGPSLPLRLMSEKFLKFAEAISEYSKIGDMHNDNLIFDLRRNEWRIMDWTDRTEKILSTDPAATSLRYSSPLRKILDEYGWFKGNEFRADNESLAWLENLIYKAHQLILQKRQLSKKIRACNRVLAEH